MSKLCNKSFISEYCFIDDDETHIDLFIQNKNNYENKILKCRKGHELILVNGKKINNILDTNIVMILVGIQ